MIYGDEFAVDVPPGFDPEQVSTAQLGKLFQHANRLSRFKSTPNNQFIHDLSHASFEGLLCYKINEDCMIEINDVTLKTPIVIRNQVSDLISFQFVSSVKRSEFLGESRNVHNLGHAMIVTVVPKRETTYRVPMVNVPIRHVAIHTTLSNLIRRMHEPRDAYPSWLLEMLDGNYKKPRQRVFFLEEIHRDLIWYCFHLPVSGALLGPWMSAKFHELLCIGLQLLKNSQTPAEPRPLDHALPSGEKIARARSILSREYSNPPALPVLARHLSISETQLKSGFKSMNGTTVLQYCIARRIDAAKLLLRENRHSISEIGDIVGYEDHSAFSRAFRRLNGCSPQEWRQSRSA